VGGATLIKRRFPQFVPALELSFAIEILIAIIGITYIYFILQPYVGFQFSPRSGQVNDIFVLAGDTPLQPGDVILKVGNLTWQEYRHGNTQPIFAEFNEKRPIPLTIRRGQVEQIAVHTVPGINPREFYRRLAGSWPLPIIFWLGGSATLLFIHPRSQVRTLLALFCYINALWLGTQVLVYSDIDFADSAFRFLIWLCVPIYFRLHWHFPQPFRPMHPWLVIFLYAIFGSLGFINALGFLPANSFIVVYPLALVSSLAMLICQFIWHGTARHAVVWLSIALLLMIVPATILNILSALNLINARVTMASVLSFAALPGVYFYLLYAPRLQISQTRVRSFMIGFFVVVLVAIIFVVYTYIFADALITDQSTAVLNVSSTILLLLIALTSFGPFLILPALANQQLYITQARDRVRIGANQAASLVFFILTLFPIAGILMVFMEFIFPNPLANTLNGIITSLIITVIALANFRSFERWFQHRVLGMPINPASLLSVYAGRITTSLELNALRDLLLLEVFPTLLVRQFSMLRLDTSLIPSEVFSLSVNTDMLPKHEQMSVLLDYAEQYLPPTSSEDLPIALGWVRLVLPLQVGNQPIGVWLLGERDPDDIYLQDEINVLKVLAGQTALALTNIEQAHNLQALYLADIERHEAERIHMAAELHDEVLNEMAALGTNLDLVSAPPHLTEAYQRAVLRVREIINGLRPAMLNYGLKHGLNGLVDDLEDRFASGATLELQITSDDSRYDPKVELHIYRIIQQACTNAYQHADCRNIRITGRLEQRFIDLYVEDNGRGFAVGKGLDLASLLSDKHFGLAGMFERAELIGATLHVESQPGRGTHIIVHWQADRQDIP
jgi:signal transduction histidine kinase